MISFLYIFNLQKLTEKGWYKNSTNISFRRLKYVEKYVKGQI